ncbi:phosphatidylcholine transfer protein, putative [Entamoeba invadens IP1]|uniref:Phosphatidylcholine transfer protein, putative n=1 Tax=Entamoeba invadens IP1 TaxID=370355 RepID=A0A0A1UF50_ENTIV|nr:phosphatidylcholine transfer protein, putative [Entamoeba invadens IP1]ELP95236.1 phosphatidylcholine transfer protein, putative [Entamoeba invadens IP1]|eukprot:XP_004262007.1 phosphatidylcholine transfer protein, putative [Entamoeba invadens IP1]
MSNKRRKKWCLSLEKLRRNKMKPFTDAEFEEFKTMCISDDGWTLANHDDINTGYTTQTENSSTLRMKLKSKLFEPFSINLVFDMLSDPQFRAEWDGNILERKTIDTIDEHNEIDYYSVSMPVVSNRDFLYQRGWKYNKDEFIIMNKSVVDQRAPEVSGIVRANIRISGYMVRIEDGKCKLYYIAHNDWNGWIPSFIFNTFGPSFCPSVLNKMAAGCKKYEDWYKQQKPYERPWKKLIEV